MKFLLLFLMITATTPAWAQEGTDKLSPRMKQALGPMLRPDWSPKKEVELTPQEARDLRQVCPHLKDYARQIFRLMTPGSATPPPAPSPSQP